MARGLDELAGAAPDDGGAAAELLPVLVAGEVVLGGGLEVVGALDPGEDVAEEDEVDPVVRVEGELGVGAVGGDLVRLERAVAGGGQGGQPGIAAGPAEAELDAEPVLDGAELALGRQAELADVVARVARVGGVDVADGARGAAGDVVEALDVAVDHHPLRLEAELAVEELDPQVGGDGPGAAADQAVGVVGGGLPEVRRGGGGVGAALVVGEELVPVDDVRAAVDDRQPLGEIEALQLRIAAAHGDEAPLVHRVELPEIVGLALLLGEGGARRAGAREVPHAGEVEVEPLPAGDEHDPVGRGLPVRVVAVARVGHHPEAPLAGHAAEAQHADRRHELAPDAVDGDRVLGAVDAGDRRPLRGGEGAEGRVAAAGRRLVAAVRRSACCSNPRASSRARGCRACRSAP